MLTEEQIGRFARSQTRHPIARRRRDRIYLQCGISRTDEMASRFEQSPIQDR